jgi:iron complex outermembrane recepter protein
VFAHCLDLVVRFQKEHQLNDQSASLLTQSQLQGDKTVKFKTLIKATVFSCIMAGPAFAQSTAATTIAQPEVAPARKVETVVVTGSSIKRAVNESALPLQIITRAELQREGISNPEQLVMQLNSNGNGLDNLASNADVVSGAARGNNGASSANLRGQGAGATLVLLNGRRVAAHGLNGGAVDINQIPLAAIDRVDILKDGASAIYGTDAIGGVINFITRKNFEGINVQAFVDKTGAGGGDIFRGSLVGGYGDYDTDGFNVFAALAYSDNKVLNGSDRDFVNTFQPNRGLSVDTRGTPFANIFPLGVGANTPLGTVINSAGTAPFFPGSTTVRASAGISLLDLPGGAGCSSVDGQQAYDEKIWDFAEAGFACAWDTGRAAVIQQPITTFNFVSRGVLRLGAHQLSAEITGSDADSSKSFSNVQISPNTSTQNFAFPRVAANAAAYDGVFNSLVAVFPTLEARRGLPLAFRFRCTDCGRRQISTNTQTGRVFVGADGPLGADWEYRAGASYAYSESQSLLGTGYYYRDNSAALGITGIISVLNSGLLNPFLAPGQTQSQAGLDALKGASAEGVTLYGGKFETTQFDGTASGPLFDLPGGKVYAAVGFDIRTENYNFNGDARAANARPIILSAPFDDGNALTGVERNINAIFGEIMLPVIENMELTLAVRRDAYSGFGTTTNPKISIKYRPIQPVMFRGSYNTGFRVPSFNQIFNGISTSPYAGRDLADPFKCPGGKPDSTKVGCEVIQPLTVGGGKRDLGPEKAEQMTFGVVFEPTPRMSFTLDWWNIERTDTITILDLQQIIANASILSDLFFRVNGNVEAIDQRWVNSGESITSGIELGARANGDIWGGTWSAGLDGTYLLEKKSRIIESLPFSKSEIGLFTFGGDLGLEWKHTAFLTLNRNNWSGSISQLYRSGYTNQELPGVTSGLVKPVDLVKEVDAYITYNASVTYKGFKNFTITAGVKNLLDTDPPFAITYDSASGAGSSWEPRVADPRGRAFTLLLDYKF